MNYHEFIMKCMEGIKPRLSDGEEIERFFKLHQVIICIFFLM